nr:MAG TPA: hypothetical protein [Caudoviricetes sp.]
MGRGNKPSRLFLPRTKEEKNPASLETGFLLKW